jgi:Predicted membrane protein (DUF2306)
VNQSTELTKPRPGSGAELNGAGQPTRKTASARSWWRQPWLALLTAVIIAWLIYFVLPHYITLDPRKAQVVFIKQFKLHYPILILHILCGAGALVLACVQMWTWLRREHPKAHRISGRLYIGAVTIGMITAIILAVAADYRDGARIGTYLSGFMVGNMVWAVLTIAITIRAYLAARRHQWARHRHFMIYSFALTLGILYSRPLKVLALDNTIPGWTIVSFLEVMGWVPWLANLAIAKWWLTRTERRPLKLGAKVSPEPAESKS